MARALDGSLAAMTDEDRIRATYREYDSSGRASLWDRSNPGFARLSRDRDRALADLLDRSLPARAATWLDVGCGDGQLIRTTLDRHPDLAATGLDLLADRIDAARLLVPSARLAVGSADALPYDDHAFDVVSAITLFSSLPNGHLEGRAAAEIRRVIRPGGWLIWYDLRYGNPSNAAVHGVGRGRLRELFPDWAPDLRSTTLAPPIARRLARATPVAYSILEAIPPLRSHLIGRLRCPS